MSLKSYKYTLRVKIEVISTIKYLKVQTSNGKPRYSTGRATYIQGKGNELEKEKPLRINAWNIKSLQPR